MGFGTVPAQDGSLSSYRSLIVVVNKSDCEQCIELNMLQQLWPNVTFVHTSTLTSEGLSTLEETIAELVLGGKVLSSESVLVTSARHQEALRSAAKHLQAAVLSLEQVPLDFVSIDLRAAYDAPGEVTGETASDDLLDRIFSEFCIGK